MILAVLDANVIVSGFPAARGAPSELIERWLVREYQLILSEHILDGVERAWRNPWFLARYPVDEARNALALLRARATMVVPDINVRNIAPDGEDDLVLATAVAGSVDFLVTGDRRFQMLDTFEGIEICTPRAFVAILDRTEQ